MNSVEPMQTIASCSQWHGCLLTCFDLLLTRSQPATYAAEGKTIQVWFRVVEVWDLGLEGKNRHCGEVEAAKTVDVDAPGFGSNLVTGHDARIQLAQLAELAHCPAHSSVPQDILRQA